MRIANLISDSIVDGPGLRLTVFTQGCPHRCPGCQNPETHDPSGGWEVSVAELAAELDKNPLLQGLTLSGGDPFSRRRNAQRWLGRPRPVGWISGPIRGIPMRRCGQRTGRTFALLLSATDVLVDGPFLVARKSYAALFRGSDNQRLIDLGRTRASGRMTLWTRPDALGHFVIPES
ncbi:MAG: 4Fe-4S cluster-binding domain-containing protein [Intestinimonas sp.]